MARIAEQRAPRTQRTHDDVALDHLGHAAAGELQRVVGGLVGQDFHDQYHAFLGRDVFGNAQINMRQGAADAAMAQNMVDGIASFDDVLTKMQANIRSTPMRSSSRLKQARDALALI